MTYKIINEANQIISNYQNQSIEILDSLQFHQYELIRMIEHYSNSRYLLNQNDELGKEKPFYNIVNGMCDVENAAVDIDTKDIQIYADMPKDYDKSFLLTVEVREWMKEADFAMTLNEIRDVRTRYGGVLVKKCMEADEDDPKSKPELKVEVCEWKNLVTDPTDILGGAIIEKHYMSPAELSKKDGVWNNVPEAMKLATKGRQSRNFTNAKATTKKVPIFEVRGEFSKAYIKQAQGKEVKDGDEYEYSYQYYVYAGESGSGQVLLYSEDNTEKIYKYLARKKKAGRALGVGIVEEGEQTQVWTNDVIQKQQRALEYTSKVLGQTASRSLKGRNMLTEVENGQILEHEDGKPISALQFSPSGGMQQFEMLTSLWFSQFEKASSGFAMQRGEVSTKNFRLQSMALQQSQSNFETLREEMGLFIGEIFCDWVLPHLSTRLNKAHILSHGFDSEDLKALDDNYSTHAANQMAIDKILNGTLVTTEDYEQSIQAAKDNVQKSKNHRFFDIPKDYYKDLETKITINTTGEQRNKALTLESLNNILVTIGQNPALLQDPVASQIFMKIIELSDVGISPMSLMASIQEQAKKQQDAQDQMQQGMPAQPGQPQQMTQPKQLSMMATGGK